MTELLLATPSAPPITIDLPAAVAAAAWVVTGLLGVMAIMAGAVLWFLRRELANNDAAHREFRSKLDKLLEGDVVWVRDLQERLRGRVE